MKRCRHDNMGRWIAALVLFGLCNFVWFLVQTAPTAHETAATKTIEPLNSTTLDQRPVDQRCAFLKFSSSTSQFNSSSVATAGQHPFRVGLRFVEGAFISRNGPGGMHFYHFMEFWVVAFVELLKLGSNETMDHRKIEVPWLHVPRIPKENICGRLQCLMSPFVFPLSNSTSIMEIFGSEVVNESAITSFQPVDATLVINREQCNHGRMNKMDADYLSAFDAQRWSQRIQEGIQLLNDSSTPSFPPPQNNQLVVTYIDRQSSFRRLPPPDHQWILKTIPQIPNISFRHVKMEQYSGSQQLHIASLTDVFIGMHGNGLTHEMFTKPGGALIELFWNKDFQYDYYTMAILMQHEYLCVYNGNVMKSYPPRNETREKAVYPLPYPPKRHGWWGTFSDESKDAIVGMIRKTIESKRKMNVGVVKEH
jgi:hypothetical protein